MDEVTRWLGVFVALVGFGWSLGLNPALYGATLDTLARGSRESPDARGPGALTRLAAMILGLFLGATVLFVVLQTINPQSFVSAVRGRIDAALLNRLVDLIAGIVFVLLGLIIVVWILRVRRLPQRTKKKPPANSGLISYFAIGLGSSVIGFTTLPIMYLTGRVVASVSTDLVPRLIAYAVFLAALASPFVAIAWTWRRFPTLSTSLTEVYARLLRWDYRYPGAALLLLGGVLFLVLAATGHH